MPIVSADIEKTEGGIQAMIDNLEMERLKLASTLRMVENQLDYFKSLSVDYDESPDNHS